MRMQTTEPCRACRGLGAVTNPATGGRIQCPLCEGEGETRRKFDKELYWIIFTRTDVAANATSPIQYQIQEEKMFEAWTRLANYTSNLLDVKLEVNGVSVMNTGFPGNQNGISVDLWTGSGQLPASDRAPMLFHPYDQLTLYLTDRSGAKNTVQAAFGGFWLTPKAPAASRRSS